MLILLIIMLILPLEYYGDEQSRFAIIRTAGVEEITCRDPW